MSPPNESGLVFGVDSLPLGIPLSMGTIAIIHRSIDRKRKVGTHSVILKQGIFAACTARTHAPYPIVRARPPHSFAHRTAAVYVPTAAATVVLLLGTRHSGKPLGQQVCPSVLVFHKCFDSLMGTMPCAHQLWNRDICTH